MEVAGGSVDAILERFSGSFSEVVKMRSTNWRFGEGGSEGNPYLSRPSCYYYPRRWVLHVSPRIVTWSKSYASAVFLNSALRYQRKVVLHHEDLNALDRWMHASRFVISRRLLISKRRWFRVYVFESKLTAQRSIHIVLIICFSTISPTFSRRLAINWRFNNKLKTSCHCINDIVLTIGSSNHAMCSMSLRALGMTLFSSRQQTCSG